MRIAFVIQPEPDCLQGMRSHAMTGFAPAIALWLFMFSVACHPVAHASGMRTESTNAVAAPSKQMVLAWWKAHSDEPMHIEGNLLALHLENRELAYLLPVSFDRARNDIWHMVLVRPKLREVREVEFPMRTARVVDLDHDGVSEVVTHQVGSGQGTNVVIDSIVHFDGWTPRLLHQVESGDNLGECGPPPNPPCKKTEAAWRFQDAILTETITTSEGTSPDEVMRPRKKGGAARTTVNRYVFSGNRFVRMKGSLEK